MSREENLKAFDFYGEEIAEFANNVKDGIYEGWGSKEMIEYDIEEIGRILEEAKKDKALLKSDLKIICQFGEDTIDKINNQFDNQ
tara:strand:- start:247 stop:501 length:255 start_codon:yes stop_codon:yes gene_type:complete